MRAHIKENEENKHNILALLTTGHVDTWRRVGRQRSKAGSQEQSALWHDPDA